MYSSVARLTCLKIEKRILFPVRIFNVHAGAENRTAIHIQLF